MFARCALAICVFAAGAAAFGEELPTAKPESVGLSSERLERIGAAVDRSIVDKPPDQYVTPTIWTGSEMRPATPL